MIKSVKIVDFQSVAELWVSVSDRKPETEEERAARKAKEREREALDPRLSALTMAIVRPALPSCFARRFNTNNNLPLVSWHFACQVGFVLHRHFADPANFPPTFALAQLAI